MALAVTPMMLTALACIHYSGGTLPEDRGDLYESLTTWLARSREKREGRVDYKECLLRLRALAYGMTTWPGGRLKQADSETAARILCDSGRLSCRDAALNFLAEEEMDSGIIVKRGPGGGAVEFSHLTYQEYLAALELDRAKFQPEKEKALRSPQRFSLEWREFLRLFAIILDRDAKQGGWLYETLLKAPVDGSLADQARTVALVRTLAAERRDEESKIGADYVALVREMEGLFEGRADGQGLELWARGEAAEAWELLVGDTSRLRLPSDEEYWEAILRRRGAGKKALGRCPVTVFEYAEYLRLCPGMEPPEYWDYQQRFPLRPVVGVSFYEAEAYCSWCGELCGRSIRLPDEQEWERAAAGRYAWGNDKPTHDHANYGYEVKHPTPVGLFPKGSPPGKKIMDLAGNVWEWTSSDYDKDKKYKVRRGGCFYYDERLLRAAIRLRYPAGSRSFNLGFRCVRE